MRPGEFPLLPIRRALVPGTRAALPSDRADLRPGDRLVTVLERPEGVPPALGSVGTLAGLESLRPLGPGISLLRLSGRSLVRLVEVDEQAGRWWAKVAEVPEPGGEAPGMVEAAGRALRRFLAAQAEAGEDADCRVDLSRDPVAASHEVASYLRVSWPEVQDVLEAGSAAERLSRARAVLERETELLRRLLGREGA
ncbi:MAG: ATP-dependent protease La substrate-binding domain [Actinobacteria bacterium]|nr:ATP-dependent protease La substrate-binding domain [Actinomycetota bacterium]